MHEQVSSDYNQESLYSIHGRIGRIRFLVYSLLLNIMLILTPAVNPVELNLGDFSYAA